MRWMHMPQPVTVRQMRGGDVSKQPAVGELLQRINAVPVSITLQHVPDDVRELMRVLEDLGYTVEWKVEALARRKKNA